MYPRWITQGKPVCVCDTLLCFIVVVVSVSTLHQEKCQHMLKVIQTHVQSLNSGFSYQTASLVSGSESSLLPQKAMLSSLSKSAGRGTLWHTPRKPCSTLNTRSYRSSYRMAAGGGTQEHIWSQLDVLETLFTSLSLEYKSVYARPLMCLTSDTHTGTSRQP